MVAAAATSAAATLAAAESTGRMQSLASSPSCSASASAGFPRFLRSRQLLAPMLSAASAKLPTLVTFHAAASPDSAASAPARRPMSSSSLHAVSPDSQNASSVAAAAAAPPPAPSSGDKNGDEQLKESSSSSSNAGPSSLAQEWGTKAPKRFQVRSGQLLNVLGGSLGAVLRFGSGAFIQGYKLKLVPSAEFPSDRYASFEVAGRKTLESGNPGPRPELPIELYEFEGCPFCRKVREIVSILDLDVLYYPTPKNGPNFRPKAIQLGGKSQFPYMVDPNTGTSMYESDDIIKYLVEKYGDGKVPIALSLGPITAITAGFAMLARAGKGSAYTPSRLPAEPLKLWAYEASPFAKIVREKLVELELPHYYYSTPRGSRKRDELFQRAGHFQVPYLEDPNNGVKMFESADIVEYLQQTYAISESQTPA